jgi:hypothetical protein
MSSLLFVLRLIETNLGVWNTGQLDVWNTGQIDGTTTDLFVILCNISGLIAVMR